MTRGKTLPRRNQYREDVESFVGTSKIIFLNLTMAMSSAEKMTENFDSNERNEAPTTIEEADKLLFGSMNSEIADALAERVRVAIADGVESLPLLTDAAKATAMAKRIEQIYMLNVDLIEAYGNRNIFTIRHYQPKRRQRILQAYLGEDLLPLPESKMSSQKPSQTDANEVSQPYPTKEQIPSPEATSALQDELSKLKEQLDEERSKQNQLIAKQKSLQDAIKVSNEAVHSLVVSSEDNVQEPVSRAISAGKSIQEMTKEGKELMKDLDESKRGRGDDENDGQGIPSTQLPVIKKKRQSLEEEYRTDRMVLGSNNNIQSLQAVRNLLKKEKD